MDIQKRIEELEHSKDEMITYLKLKVRLEDWHGVMDASCDIREIDAELKGLRRRVEGVDEG